MGAGWSGDVGGVGSCGGDVVTGGVGRRGTLEDGTATGGDDGRATLGDGAETGGVGGRATLGDGAATGGVGGRCTLSDGAAMGGVVGRSLVGDGVGCTGREVCKMVASWRRAVRWVVSMSARGLAGVGCCSAAIRSETAAAAASREEVAGRGVWMGCQVMVSMMRTALVSVA